MTHNNLGPSDTDLIQFLSETAPYPGSDPSFFSTTIPANINSKISFLY
jgi:hypothetical protein